MTADEVVEVMQLHEWHYKEGLKRVYCPSCGKEYKAETYEKGGNMFHRQDCGYKKIMVLAVSMATLNHFAKKGER